MSFPALLVAGIVVAMNALLLASDETPRWGILGGEEQLKLQFEERREVVLVCVFDTEVHKIPHRDPRFQSSFAEIVFHATVVSVHKGTLKVGQKIKIGFLTDSLEGDENQQNRFMEATNARNKGALKFAFLKNAKDGQYSCEWLDLPDFSGDMQTFLKRLETKAAEPRTDSSPSGSDAKLAPEGVLSLKERDIRGAPTLRGDYVVSAKGEVILPYLGAVAVAGLTKAQAIDRIADAWSAAGMQMK